MMEIVISLAFVAALCGVHAYFHSRRDKPPSMWERLFAGIWLVMRRVLCFGMAFCFWGGSCALIYQIAIKATPLSSLLWLGFLVPLGYLFVHWGLYGRGYKKHDFTDDRRAHEARKKRYGWRW